MSTLKDILIAVFTIDFAALPSNKRLDGMLSVLRKAEKAINTIFTICRNFLASEGTRKAYSKRVRADYHIVSVVENSGLNGLWELRSDVLRAIEIVESLKTRKVEEKEERKAAKVAEKAERKQRAIEKAEKAKAEKVEKARAREEKKAEKQQKQEQESNELFWYGYSKESEQRAKEVKAHYKEIRKESPYRTGKKWWEMEINPGPWDKEKAEKKAAKDKEKAEKAKARKVEREKKAEQKHVEKVMKKKVRKDLGYKEPAKVRLVDAVEKSYAAGKELSNNDLDEIACHLAFGREYKRESLPSNYRNSKEYTYAMTCLSKALSYGRVQWFSAAQKRSKKYSA